MATAWSVHLPTVDATCVRLAVPPVRGRDPWPLPRILADLVPLGARPSEERPRSVGAGRGAPILSSRDLAWHDLRVTIEAFHDVRGLAAEVSLVAPPWDELCSAVSEGELWDLVDTAAAAAAAVWGAVSDGEALEMSRPSAPAGWAAALSRHIGVLAPGGTAVPPASGALHRRLPRSALDVFLR